jgi:hypothetical protein
VVRYISGADLIFDSRNEHLLREGERVERDYMQKGSDYSPGNLDSGTDSRND